ncbi:MAG: SDR family NAD(P)-dependent oxidoreductase [Rubrimonas sp.]|uniref:SDR family NAD(P)-dependent oxidoreductase n=1 Tax=Rubrimonas sp. TaxID=2036015 RepID=UPI002FDD7F5D
MSARFGPQARAAVFGASGGIGGALAATLARDPGVAEVLCFSRSGRAPEGMTAAPLDILDEAAVAAAAEAAGPLDLAIVATGLLHDGDRLRPEKDMRALSAARLAESFAVNAIGPALVGKHVLPKMRRDRRAVFAALSARVGSIGDNAVGGWYGYRASKAALNMILKNFAIETARRQGAPIVLGLQPGTVDTSLSKPFQSAAPRLFTPEQSAAALLEVIAGATPDQSGRLLDWSGAVVPW